jgi:hypothetical protein
MDDVPKVLIDPLNVFETRFLKTARSADLKAKKNRFRSMAETGF